MDPFTKSFPMFCSAPSITKQNPARGEERFQLSWKTAVCAELPSCVRRAVLVISLSHYILMAPGNSWQKRKETDHFLSRMPYSGDAKDSHLLQLTEWDGTC
eukprot:XP_025011834.1 uncharacterized protein LOC112533635 [Gallus gallus]